jgi:hypothetical protein
MTWYVQLLQVTDMLAAREEEARKLRLARLAAGDDARHDQRPAAGVARRVAARLAVAVGRSATRIACALDAETARAA